MKILRTMVLAALFSLSCFGLAHADQKITASNVDSIKANIPPFMYEWIKAGKGEMNIVDKLPFNPTATLWGLLPEEAEKTKANAGKYAVDDKRQLTTASGELWPRPVYGLPFPEISKDDPMAGTKLVYNNKFRDLSFTPVNSINGYAAVTADGSQGVNMQAARMTTRGTEEYDFMYIHSIKTPYNMNGSVILDMRQINPDGPRVRYAYNPGTRKVMRFPSKFDCSEQNAGTAMCEDDHAAGATQFRLKDTIYKFMGVKEFYVAYASLKPLEIKSLPNGGYRVENDKPETEIKLGFSDPNWKGYGWWPLSVVYVKRTVWEFQFDQVDTDPERLGTENYTWIDPELAEYAYKYMTNPDGEPYRAVMGIFRFAESADKKIFFTRMTSPIAVDITSGNLGTISYQLHQPGNYFEFKLPEGRVDKRFFTKDGFVKFGK